MLKLVYGFVIIFLIAFYSSTPETMDKTIMAALLAIVFVCIFFFILRKERVRNLKGQPLKHSTLALVGILIVFFQYPLDYVLGNVNRSNMFIWVDQGIVIKSLTLAVIGLICFLLGYLTFKEKLYRVHIKIGRASKVNVLIALATISLCVYFLTVNPLYLAGYYGIVEMGNQATYAIRFFEILTMASVIQKCRNMLILEEIPNTFMEYFKKIGWLLISLILVYLLSVLLSGDRGPIIVYSILLFSGYFFVTKKKLSIGYLVLFLFIGAFVFTSLKIAHSYNKNLSFIDRVKRSLNETESGSKSSISPQTQELAGSVRALHWAMSYVPQKHGFLYGRFQFNQFLAAIPLVSNFMPLLYNETSYKYKGSASFITWIRQGNNPTSGDGTSCMADFYFDFGLVGVIIGMFFYGYLMRYAEVEMYSNKLPFLFTQVFFTVYLCRAIYISRSSVLLDFKTVVWIYVILLVNMTLQQRQVKKV